MAERDRDPRREKLHEKLCDILGSRNVYFQPPEDVKLKYPAIIYSRTGVQNIFADNAVYLEGRTYLLTLVDSNPDSRFVGILGHLPTCRFQRHYKSDNLNHDVFVIYW